MTNVLTDIREFVETEEVKVDCPTPKLDIISDFLTLKIFANRNKDKIYKNIERNKKIRNGQTVIAGTRITTKELLSIMSENISGQNVFKYICKEYPSIDNEEKILYGALYEIKKKNSLLFILWVLFGK